MKLSRITRHALIASFGAIPGTLILLWVLLNYGHDRFFESYALLTAWVIQGVMIFAFMGEGSSSEKKPVEGNTEGRMTATELEIARRSTGRCLSSLADGSQCVHEMDHRGYHEATGNIWDDEMFQFQSEEGGDE